MIVVFNSNSKIKQIIVSLFLVSFIVYAISPLSYSGSFSNGEQTSYVQQNSKVSLKNVRIYFLNILLSNFSSETDQNRATPKFLLKKVRAVLQSLADTKKVPLDSSNISAYFSVSDRSPWSGIRTQEGIPKPYQNFLFVFSGLSPPSV